MRVMILGATGLLGQALVRGWSRDEVIGLGSRDVDIRDERKTCEHVQRIRPDWIVLAAAYTNVDGCETNRERAFAVNRDGAGHVAEAARSFGGKLLFVSSDYVFDGTKTSPYETDDSRHPLGVYGSSKAEAEVRLQESLPNCCIVRTSWLFGTGGKCFPDTILKLAGARLALDVVNDQRGCPTYSADLAQAIIQLCRQDASGIVHVTNAGNCTWFEFARDIVGQSGLTTPVRPITTEQMPLPARRPAYSVLSAASLERFGIAMPTWQDAVTRYLKERQPEAIKRWR
jgi:dTDP-4-dehydrorhamnose reductase